MSVVKVLSKEDLQGNIRGSLLALKEIALKHDIISDGDIYNEIYLSDLIKRIQMEEWVLDDVSAYLDSLRSSFFLAGFKNNLPHAKCCLDEVNWKSLAQEIVNFLI